MTVRISLSILTTLLALLTTPAHAQQYPSRPVTIVVPFAAGGGSDLLARLVAQKLEEKLGKPFIIENRPGAATTLAAMQVVRAAPDGYMLMQATSSTMAINVSMSKKLAYEPLKDLVPVALLSSSPFFLVVNKDSPLKIGRRPDLARQGQAEQLELRLRRARLDAPSQHRAVAEPGRYPDDTRALQGDAAGDERSSCRQHPGVVWRHHLDPAVHQAGHRARPCGHHGEAQPSGARCAGRCRDGAGLRIRLRGRCWSRPVLRRRR